MFTDPAWSVASATWGLLLVTLAAVVVGGIAALSASRTYDLELQPVIIVRQLEMVERVESGDATVSPQSFTVAPKPTLAEGIELRENLAKDHHDPNVSLVNCNTRLELTNVGRSAALDVCIPFTVSASYMCKEDINFETGRCGAHTQEGQGNIVVSGIAPNATTCIIVHSLIGVPVTLKAADFGTCTRIEGAKKKRRPLAVVSLRDIQIPRNS